MNESACRYRFGEYVLIPACRELARAGQRLSVQPKVFDTLAYLLSHRDRAVGRDELVAAVWGRVDVSDNVLTQIVGRARRAVDDTAGEQHSIFTLPHFGYQWVREVEVEVAPAGVDTSAQSVAPVLASPVVLAPSAAPIRGHRLLMMVALAALGVAGIAAIGFLSVANPTGSSVASRDAADAADAPVGERLAALRHALALDLLDRARALDRTFTDRDRINPAVRDAAALLALQEGRADEALAAFSALLTDLGEHGDPLLVGQALHGAGRAAARARLLEPAQRYYEQAANVLDGQTTPEARAARGRALNSLGRLLFDRGALDAAERAYAQAGAALNGTDDLSALAQWESNTGVLLIGRYHHADALPRFERAAALAARAGDVSGEARARLNLANVQLVLLQPAVALAAEPRLRTLRERVSDPWLAGNIDLVRARVLVANGRLSGAELVLQAHAGRPSPAEPALTAFREVVAAELAFARGALDAGTKHATAALASPWSVPENVLAAYARYRLLMARQALGDAAGLADAAAAADAQSRARPTELIVRLYALLARGEAAAAAGNLEAARADFTQALAQAETNGVPFDVAQATGAYTRFLVRHGESAEAGPLVARLAAWAERDYGASLVQLAVYHAAGDDAWRSALERTRRLAGERVIPAALTLPPAKAMAAGERVLVAGHGL
ncbi:MAG TPA: winged helix-turn-helix domain-containing protein [Fontimonas sp.]